MAKVTLETITVITLAPFWDGTCLIFTFNILGHMLWSRMSICWEAGHCEWCITLLTYACPICALWGTWSSTCDSAQCLLTGA